LVGSAPAWADDPVVFKSDVSLVRVDAQVVDRNNRPIAGLGPRDFVLRDNGKLQKIQSVDAENLPIDLLLLLDVSASMRPHIQRITDASHEALRQLREEDRVAIMVFDRYTRVRMAFRNSQSNVDRELQRLLDQESFHGGTDITLGLMDAAAYIRREGRREARKAIVIVTDDETERSKDVEGVSRELARADAVLSALIAPDAMGTHRMGGGYPGGGYPGGGYPGGGGGWGGIILGGGGGRRNRYPGAAGMGTQSAGTREIAERSGGDSMGVDSAYALQDTLARIRERYALHFALPPGVRAGDERNIDLQLADATRSRYPAADVKYRRSYYAPVSSPAGSGSSEERVVVSSAGSSSSGATDDTDRPRLRRPGVSQVPSGSGGGPLVVDDGNAHSNSPSAAPPSDQPVLKRADPNPAPAPNPNAPGWRKAQPEDLPH
jgi:VWFA-related protein